MDQRKHRMKRITAGLLAGLLTLSLAAGLSAAYAQEAADMDPNYEPEPTINTEDFGYQQNGDGTITIAEYTGSSDVIAIPTEIDGFPVSGIGYQAFSNYKMKSLSIPGEVRTIEQNAFDYCKISDSVTLPSDVVIKGQAFSYVQFPAEVTIPSGAQLEARSFEYCKGVEMLLLEGGVTVKEHAFDYCKDLRYVVCAPGVKLENSAFDYCDTLEQVILCGEVKTEEEPVTNSDAAELVSADEKAFDQIAEELRSTTESTGDTGEYAVGEMTFFVPSEMVKTSQPGYDLFLISSNMDCMIGAAEYPPSVLDLEKDETVQTMVKSAEGFVTVDAAYKVKICGYPAVWIDMHNDEGSAGVYLYISLEDKMYFLTYVNMTGVRGAFYEIAQSVAIGGGSEGTDLSPLAASWRR